MKKILLISSWSFVMVLSSVFFTFAGIKLDLFFETPPTFMIGLLILSAAMSIYKLFEETKK